MDSPRVGLGRGVVYGVVSLDSPESQQLWTDSVYACHASQFYNTEGKIIAAAAQEGVARGARTANPVLGHLAKNKHKL